MGKTGTAEVRANKQDTALFVMVTPPQVDPANPQPQYVIVVVVEQGGFGGSVAAPIAPPRVRRPDGRPEPAARPTLPAREQSTDGAGLMASLAAALAQPVAPVDRTATVAPRRQLARPRLDHARRGHRHRRARPGDGVLVDAQPGRRPVLLREAPGGRVGRRAWRAFLVILRIDYRKFRDFSLLAYIAVIALLFFVLTPFGSSSKGAQAWYALPGGLPVPAVGDREVPA